MRRVRRVIAVAAWSGFLAFPAFAGDPKPPAEPAGTPLPAPVSAEASGMEGRKPTDVLRFEAIVIEGRAQAPLAIHLLDRSKGSFGELLPDESLLPRIFEAVESEPF